LTPTPNIDFEAKDLFVCIHIKNADTVAVVFSLRAVEMVFIRLLILTTSCLLQLAAGIQSYTFLGQEAQPIAVDPASCLEAVIVEPRKLRTIATALESAALSNNADFDLLTIAVGDENGEYVKQLVQNSSVLLKLRMQGLLRFRKLPFRDLGGNSFDGTNRTANPRGHHDQYSRVLMSAEFWEGFTCNRILLMQSDTVLCSNSNVKLSDYFKYEYVGGRTHNLDKKYFPGRRHLNGGLSFRNRLGMLRCIKSLASYPDDVRLWLDQLPEDGFFSNCKELEQPSGPVLRRFAIASGSFEMEPDQVPFGVHSPWQESSCKGCSKSNLQHCVGAIKLLQDTNPRRARKIMKSLKLGKWR